MEGRDDAAVIAPHEILHAPGAAEDQSGLLIFRADLSVTWR